MSAHEHKKLHAMSTAIAANHSTFTVRSSGALEATSAIRGNRT